MCSYVYRDREGKSRLVGRFYCRKIDNNSLGDEITGYIRSKKSINAREESLEKVWFPRGSFYVQIITNILSFREKGHIFKLRPEVDIVTILIPNTNDIRFITRPDGLTYFEKYGKYPPFTDKKIAELEHRIHSRWPLYRRRIPC